MAHLIDKDALVAKIERRMKYNHERAYLDRSPSMAGRESEDKDILSLLDTLEVKDVDLKEEVERFAKECGYKSAATIDFQFAKHFFEIGLQAQQNNWKVVDNTNLPQGDRTKIYCVFTKQRYILAKVISHPQDEDLLQWKCTEFPHHCYDMCEGDKYMPIV